MSNTPRTDKLEREIATGDWSDATVIMNLLFTMREWEGAIAVFVGDEDESRCYSNFKRLKEIGTCPTCRGTRTIEKYTGFGELQREQESCPDCMP